MWRGWPVQSYNILKTGRLSPNQKIKNITFEILLFIWYPMFLLGPCSVLQLWYFVFAVCRSPPSSPRKSPRHDSLPSSTSKRKNNRSSVQGKITDLFKRTSSGSGSKSSQDNSSSSSSSKQSKSPARSTPSKTPSSQAAKKTVGRPKGKRGRKPQLQEEGRGQRTAASPQARAGYLKKRGAGDDEDEWVQPSPAKRAKTMAAQKSVRSDLNYIKKKILIAVTEAAR